MDGCMGSFSATGGHLGLIYLWAGIAQLAAVGIGKLAIYYDTCCIIDYVALIGASKLIKINLIEK